MDSVRVIVKSQVNMKKNSPFHARQRGRPKKIVSPAEDLSEEKDAEKNRPCAENASQTMASPEAQAAQFPRKRGRPRKSTIQSNESEHQQAVGEKDEHKEASTDEEQPPQNVQNEMSANDDTVGLDEEQPPQNVQNEMSANDDTVGVDEEQPPQNIQNEMSANDDTVGVHDNADMTQKSSFQKHSYDAQVVKRKRGRPRKSNVIVEKTDNKKDSPIQKKRKLGSDEEQSKEKTLPERKELDNNSKVTDDNEENNCSTRSRRPSRRSASSRLDTILQSMRKKPKSRTLGADIGSLKKDKEAEGNEAVSPRKRRVGSTKVATSTPLKKRLAIGNDNRGDAQTGGDENEADSENARTGTKKEKVNEEEPSSSTEISSGDQKTAVEKKKERGSRDIGKFDDSVVAAVFDSVYIEDKDQNPKMVTKADEKGSPQTQKEDSRDAEVGEDENDVTVASLSDALEGDQDNTHDESQSDVTHEMEIKKSESFNVQCDDSGNLTLTLLTNNTVKREQSFVKKRRGRRVVEEDRRKCTCGKVFPTISAMLKHCWKTGCQDPITVYRPYKCDQCGFSAARESKLEEHVSRKHREKHLQCPKCTSKFAMELHLQQHLQYAHDPAYRQRLMVKQSVMTTCDICGKEVKKCRLSEHRKLKHTDRSKLKQNEYKCEKCDFVTRTKKVLEHHLIRIHTGKTLKCPHCDRMFSMAVDMESHIAVNHSDKPDANLALLDYCPVCNKRMLKKTIKNHINMVHCGLKPYACTLCGKKFATRSMVKAHEEAHKDDSERVRRYLCSHCGKRFLQSEQYKAHLNSHTGARPYHCSLCPATFTSKLCLTRHQGTHVEDKAYTCDKCDKSFKTEKYLRTHKLRHSKLLLSVCVCGFSVPEQQVFDRHLLKCPAYLSLHTKQKQLMTYVYEDAAGNDGSSTQQQLHQQQVEEESSGETVDSILHVQATSNAAEDGAEHSATYQLVDTGNGDSQFIFIEDGEIVASSMNLEGIEGTEEVKVEESEVTEELRQGYQCGFCDALFFEVEEIKTHMKDIHNVEVTTQVVSYT